MTDNISKVLGSASYEAHWVHKSLLVKLIARGVLPCSNYTAQLEQRPERIEPPEWNMVFFVPDTCEKGLSFFEETVTMANTSGAPTIAVHDAAGRHEIPIKQQFEVEEEDEQFIVYGKLPKREKGHSGCIIVPADGFVSAIHYRAFGLKHPEKIVKSLCNPIALVPATRCSWQVAKFLGQGLIKSPPQPFK
ncbi:hypothetical protein QTO30_07790 [Yoonia sp. GPGPB17]|uniref:hypothetical protein n=1 Tax=Yoonia sp. GPGPB17 TaxID=3026147 RepID=UPI0030C4896D